MAYCKVDTGPGFTVVSNNITRDERLSLKAKGLLCVILSLPPKWDMTIEGLAGICVECSDTISNILKEIESAGYLSRYRERDSHGRYGEMIYHFFQTPLHNDPIRDLPKRKLPKGNFSGQVNPILEMSGQLNKDKLNKEELNKDSYNILSINHADAMDEMRNYKAVIYKNIDYEVLAEQVNKEKLDEIVEIMLDCMCSQAETIVVGKTVMPKETVKSRFLKIDSSHIEYVIECLNNNTTKVRNIKAYLITALYNAPLTITNYYAAEVRHDLYGTD